MLSFCYTTPLCRTSLLLLVDQTYDTSSAVRRAMKPRFWLRTVATTSFFIREVAIVGDGAVVVDLLPFNAIDGLNRRLPTATCAPPASCCADRPLCAKEATKREPLC